MHMSHPEINFIFKSKTKNTWDEIMRKSNTSYASNDIFSHQNRAQY